MKVLALPKRKTLSLSSMERRLLMRLLEITDEDLIPTALEYNFNTKALTKKLKKNFVPIYWSLRLANTSTFRSKAISNKMLVFILKRLIRKLRAVSMNTSLCESGCV